MNRHLEKKTQQKAKEMPCDRLPRFELNEEGKAAASKLLDMAQRWRASRWENRGTGKSKQPTS